MGSGLAFLSQITFHSNTRGGMNLSGGRGGRGGGRGGASEVHN